MLLLARHREGAEGPTARTGKGTLPNPLCLDLVDLEGGGVHYSDDNIREETAKCKVTEKKENSPCLRGQSLMKHPDFP